MTEPERRYRKGCFQVVNVLLSQVNLSMTPREIIQKLAQWKLALHGALEDPDVKYLGRYLQTIQQDVAEQE